MGAIHSLGTNYPDERSLPISYTEIDAFDPLFADYIEHNPDMALGEGMAVIREILRSHTDIEKIDDMEFHIRLFGIPKDIRIQIRNIRKEHIGKLLSMEGVIRRNNEVKPKVTVAAFKCTRCSQINLIHQESPNMREPLECLKDDDGGGGCGRSSGSTRFTLCIQKSILEDTEKIEIQERPDGLRAGSQPQALVGYAFDDRAGIINPGDKVIINGILRAIQNKERTTLDLHLDVNNIELIDAQTEDYEVTPEEQQQIDDLGKQPDILDILSGSIAPTIQGYEYIKQAIVLQMCGGTLKTNEDGTRLRGDIHILLIGDPGTAKTQLLLYAAGVMPRGLYASGKGSSTAGLTAACTHDDFGEGRWTLEAGVMPLADGGMACIDELDKMTDEDRAAMHEAMEQQTIHINKATIHTELQSRCSVFAAANPKEGRFFIDGYQTIAKQINLPPTLLSRFDLIFPIKDIPNAEKDNKIAEHILSSHLAGEFKRSQTIETPSSPRQRIIEALETIKPPVSQSLMRKYIWMARKKNPIMTDEALSTIKNFYLEIRKIGERANAPIPMTARQLGAIIRLSEASARTRLSNEVVIEDVQTAISVFAKYLDSIGFDIDYIEGTPKSQRDVVQALNRLIIELSRNGGFTYSELIESASSEGIDSGKCQFHFNRMKRDGDIQIIDTGEDEPIYKNMRD